MQAYMKSGLPFHGIAAPLRRRLMKAVAAAHPANSAQALADTMQALWHEAAFREERYVASELAGLPAHRAWQGLALLPVYETMITTGAWWDHCDEVSGNALPVLLQRHPTEMKAVVRRWMVADNLWLRRASMLCQRRLKGAAFDAVLFYETVLANLAPAPFHGDFFIRKGMGWALRERTYAAPDEVRAFFAEYVGKLSPLTQREALKRLVALNR